MLKVEFDFDLMLIWIAVVLGGLAISYIFCDINYFLRAAWVIGYGRLIEGKSKPDDETTIYGMCLISDLDIMLKHMNNARYLRELDFGRYHFYDRSGIFKALRASGGNVVQSACNIRYRRPIPLLTAYKVTTKLIYWDEKALYLEQQFVTLKDNFIRAIAFSKQGTVGVDVTDVMTKFFDKDVSGRPEPPTELQHFMDCLEVSSKKLRKKDE